MSISQQIEELANSIRNKVQSEDGAQDEDAGAVSKALDSLRESNTDEDAEDAAQDSEAQNELVELLSMVNEKLDERDAQIEKLLDTIRVLVKDMPVPSSNEDGQKPASSNGVPGQFDPQNPFKDLNLRK